MGWSAYRWWPLRRPLCSACCEKQVRMTRVGKIGDAGRRRRGRDPCAERMLGRSDSEPAPIVAVPVRAVDGGTPTRAVVPRVWWHHRPDHGEQTRDRPGQDRAPTGRVSGWPAAASLARTSPSPGTAAARSGRKRTRPRNCRAPAWDINIEGLRFHRARYRPHPGDNLCEIGIQFNDDFYRVGRSASPKPFPPACEVAKELTRQSIVNAKVSGPTGRRLALGAAALSVVMVAEWDAVKGRLRAACLLTAPPSEPVKRVRGALLSSPDIQRQSLPDTSRAPSWRGGAGSRQSGQPGRHHPVLVRAGQLDNERKVAQNLKYQIESPARSAGSVDRDAHQRPQQGVRVWPATPASVVGWWINPQAPGIDTCAQASKLSGLTLATNS